MAKIITFGELMLRLSPSGNNRFVQANAFDVIPGGGEANVAVACANYGHEVEYVTKLPDNDIAQIAINQLRRYGVGINFIKRGGKRIGLYFAETGFCIRPSKVIYDRTNSAIAEAASGDFDWDKIFDNANWFHWSGITPALSDSTAIILKEALVAAKKNGITISCDLNYRKKLWTSEKAISIMSPLMEFVDVCIGNEEDAELCLGYKPDADIRRGRTTTEGYKSICKQMQKDFGFKYVVFTLRESYSASHNGWKALLYNGTDFIESKYYDINPIVDRVGSGDAFVAGLIHGLITMQDEAHALEFAVAASALKHTIYGDFNLVNIQEVENLVNGNLNGRIQR